MNAVVVIPARMASTRFPGKPLAELAGKPMIQWVYERASRARCVSRVIVATCDQVIADAVAGFGGEAVMTSDAHRSGTDRIAEAAAGIEADTIVNVQGDEPLIDPAAIDKAIEPFAPHPGPSFDSAQDRLPPGERELVCMTSLMVPISREAAAEANLVKVVVDRDNWALYFSRSAIPYERDVSGPAGPAPAASLPKQPVFYGHVGLYAYTKDFLLRFASLEPTPLEMAESLEQLRALEHGYRIKMVEIADRPLGVDTMQDLERATRMLKSQCSMLDSQCSIGETGD